MKVAKDIDEYISLFPPETQVILKKVRQLVKKVAPKTEEAISYDIPTFKLDGKYFIYMAGWKDHVSMYPVSAAMEEVVPGVSAYVSGKGTIKFLLSKPIPYDLIEEIVKFKVKEH